MAIQVLAARQALVATAEYLATQAFQDLAAIRELVATVEYLDLAAIQVWEHQVTQAHQVSADSVVTQEQAAFQALAATQVHQESRASAATQERADTQATRDSVVIVAIQVLVVTQASVDIQGLAGTAEFRVLAAILDSAVTREYLVSVALVVTQEFLDSAAIAEHRDTQA